MSEYRFFGLESIVNGAALSRYGQVVDMDPEAATKLIVDSPPALLLPENLWAPIGITDAELAEFPSVAIHSAAPEDFGAKTQKVRQAYHDYRAGLIAAAAPKAQPEAAEARTPANAKEPDAPAPAASEAKSEPEPEAKPEPEPAAV